MRRHQCLDLMPSLQEMGAVDAQLVRQVLSRDALRNPAQDLDDGRTVIARFPPKRAGKQIEDRPTLATAIVGNRRTSATMGCLIGGEQVSMRTVQPIWVQGMQQEFVAGVFIQQAVKGKPQHWSTSFCAVPSLPGAARSVPAVRFTIEPT